MLEDGTRIRHRGIEKERKEFVPQVVMRDDVPATAGPGVPLQPVRGVRKRCKEPRPASLQRPHCRLIRGDGFDQPRQVIAVPQPVEIGFGQSDTAAECRRAVECGMVNANGDPVGPRVRVRRGGFTVLDQPHAAVWQGRHGAADQPAPRRLQKARRAYAASDGAAADRTLGQRREAHRGDTAHVKAPEDCLRAGAAECGLAGWEKTGARLSHNRNASP